MEKFSNPQLAIKYLRYRLNASNGKGHGIHSPFVFEFITTVLNDRDHYPEYDAVEDLRKKLSNDPTILQVEDLGAGAGRKIQRSVSSIAKHAAKPRKFGQLLFRMVKKYQPKVILELGTSLGITTSYLSLAKADASVVTMEGATEVAAIAANNFKDLGLKNVTIVEGNFDNTLSSTIERMDTLDLVFIDGNHRKDPTLNYFNRLQKKLHNDGIVIFDDIHWSPEMEEAWEFIKKHPDVRYSIDLFFVGIVFFRREFHEKQDFTIRF